MSFPIKDADLKNSLLLLRLPEGTVPVCYMDCGKGYMIPCGKFSQNTMETSTNIAGTTHESSMAMFNGQVRLPDVFLFSLSFCSEWAVSSKNGDLRNLVDVLLF